VKATCNKNNIKASRPTETQKNKALRVRDEEEQSTK